MKTIEIYKRCNKNERGPHSDGSEKGYNGTSVKGLNNGYLVRIGKILLLVQEPRGRASTTLHVLWVADRGNTFTYKR